MSENLAAFEENTVHRSWFPRHDWSLLLRSVVPGVSFSGFQVVNGLIGSWGLSISQQAGTVDSVQQGNRLKGTCGLTQLDNSVTDLRLESRVVINKTSGWIFIARIENHV